MRKSPTSNCYKEDQMKDVLELVDVEDEERAGEVSKNPDLSTLSMLQVVSKAIDISLAKTKLALIRQSIWAVGLGCLQPSEVHRTKCLTMAIADILWRAGGNEKAIVALPSGRQQFTPVGKYKADGILETLINSAYFYWSAVKVNMDPFKLTSMSMSIKS
ncbi:hypothetical protein llap_17698 [Limosa lapponica baueri]|uniref:Ubiquitin carboxyl-terminal hydrolase MINDY n=1 Tax=Limosa lapponica baueri TaxID=1758121 RepID=A0A2I0TDW3_LIMLA|nr:hypothetical protein llap_17698 [Limosa lapponica baueri]